MRHEVLLLRRDFLPKEPLSKESRKPDILPKGLYMLPEEPYNLPKEPYILPKEPCILTKGPTF